MTARAALLALAVIIPGAAHAQAYQCTIPRGPVSVPVISRDGPIRQVPVTGYTLAISWSPSTAVDARRAWPTGGNVRARQAASASWCTGYGPRVAATWPQWCPARSAPTSREIAANLCLTPSAALLAHEWAKHGACMVRRPESYFRVTRILWNSLRWPDFDRIARNESLTAGDIRNAFAQANRHWEPEHVGLVVNERGWLTEMRLCYGKDFMPIRCDTRRFGPPDSAPVNIWRGL